MAGENGTLVTRNRRGGRVVTPLHVTNFSTGISLEITSDQVHGGVVHRPNHQLSERSVEFSCIFGVRQWPEMEALSERIRDHHFYSLSVGIPAPMEFRYNAIKRIYHGFIESVERGDERHKSTYTRSFRLRLVNQTNERAASLVARGPLPFVPNPTDVAEFGEDWYKFAPVPTRPTSGPGSKGYAGVRAV